MPSGCKKAVLGTYGDTIHTIIERKNYKGAFLPGYEPFTSELAIEDAGLIGIDHVVGNVERMEEWVEYYSKVMGFIEMKHFSDKDITTEYSALMSKVMHNGVELNSLLMNQQKGRENHRSKNFWNSTMVQVCSIWPF